MKRRTSFCSLLGAALLLLCAHDASATNRTVTNLNDSGAGSLRDTIAASVDGDSIDFAVGGTISLTSAELLVSHSITINGPGANMLTVRRNSATRFRIFHVTPGQTVTIAGLTISNGFAEGNYPADAGGGILNERSTLTVNACVLSGNSATALGGAVYSGVCCGNSASLLINNSTVSGNSAESGGGVANTDLSSNSAQFGGGVYNYSEGSGNAPSLQISNGTFSTNSASGQGGGIFSSGALQVSNSTLSGNSAFDGGGILTFTLIIGNTILNAGASGANISNEGGGGTITSHGYNLSSDNGGGFLTGTGDQINTDPMLGPLKDNGGPTDTHAPLTGSPAIDTGKDIGATGQDQRGSVRPIRFDPLIVEPPGGDGSDIGAVELAVGVEPTSAAARKTHGSAGNFDINLPLSGNVGIECRSGGASNDYQMIVNFAQPVTFSSAAVTSGIGSVASSSGSGTTQITINLTGVTNAQRITVALFDVNDGTHSGDVGIRMGVLVGDTTGNGVVNAADIGQTKSQVGQAVSGSNFRADVAPNGIINASDVALVKSKSGTALP